MQSRATGARRLEVGAWGRGRKQESQWPGRVGTLCSALRADAEGFPEDAQREG